MTQFSDKNREKVHIFIDLSESFHLFAKNSFLFVSNYFN